MKYKVKKDILVRSDELLYKATIPAGTIIELEEVTLAMKQDAYKDNIQLCVHGMFFNANGGRLVCPHGCPANKN